MFTKLRDPISAITHIFGFVAGIPVMIALILLAKSTLEVVSFTIFGLSLLMLYGASSVYHSLKISEKGIALLKKIDHIMIFFLIAGTYTPVCLISLKGDVGYTLFIVVWTFAILGVFLKVFWIKAPRWLSTLIYVAMGWLVVSAIMPMIEAFTLQGVLMLLYGGIAYTLGALIYGFKWSFLKFKHFGFHEMFHVFVLCGSFFHILFMFKYVVN